MRSSLRMKEKKTIHDQKRYTKYNQGFFACLNKITINVGFASYSTFQEIIQIMEAY